MLKMKLKSRKKWKLATICAVMDHVLLRKAKTRQVRQVLTASTAMKDSAASDARSAS